MAAILLGLNVLHLKALVLNWRHECKNGPNHKLGLYVHIQWGTVINVIRDAPLPMGYVHTKNETIVINIVEVTQQPQIRWRDGRTDGGTKLNQYNTPPHHQHTYIYVLIQIAGERTRKRGKSDQVRGLSHYVLFISW